MLKTPLAGSFTGWIHEINSKDGGNVRLSMPGCGGSWVNSLQTVDCSLSLCSNRRKKSEIPSILSYLDFFSTVFESKLLVFFSFLGAFLEQHWTLLSLAVAERQSSPKFWKKKVALVKKNFQRQNKTLHSAVWLCVAHSAVRRDDKHPKTC